MVSYSQFKSTVKSKDGLICKQIICHYYIPYCRRVQHGGSNFSTLGAIVATAVDFRSIYDHKYYDRNK